MSDELKNLMEVVCKALVDMPDSVNVTVIEGEQTTMVELRVDDSDRGKLIGKKGKNADALRVILSAAAAKLRKRAHLEIIE